MFKFVFFALLACIALVENVNLEAKATAQNTFSPIILVQPRLNKFDYPGPISPTMTLNSEKNAIKRILEEMTTDFGFTCKRQFLLYLIWRFNLQNGNRNDLSSCNCSLLNAVLAHFFRHEGNSDRVHQMVRLREILTILLRKRDR